MPQTVLIIGGTSGLGRRLAELYADEGAKVAVVGRRQELLDELYERSRIHGFCLDISRPDCGESVSSIIEQIGGIDILVIAASVVELNPTLSLSIEQTTLATNVVGFTSVLATGYHYFKNRKSGQLVAITSIAAARGNKPAPAYNASKAFQAAYLEGIRIKLLHENRGIQVTEIVPGYIHTQMAKGDRLFWIASLDKAAVQTKHAIDHKRGRVFVTKRWILFDKICRYLPFRLYAGLVNSNIKLLRKS